MEEAEGPCKKQKSFEQHVALVLANVEQSVMILPRWQTSALLQAHWKNVALGVFRPVYFVEGDFLREEDYENVTRYRVLAGDASKFCLDKEKKVLRVPPCSKFLIETTQICEDKTLAVELADTVTLDHLEILYDMVMSHGLTFTRENFRDVFFVINYFEIENAEEWTNKLMEFVYKHGIEKNMGDEAKIKAFFN